MSVKDIVLTYCKDVKENKIIAGRYCKKAIARFLNDLSRSEKESGFPFFVDWEEAETVIAFAQALHIPDLNGKCLELFPFQMFLYTNIWAWKYKDNHERRRFRTCFIEIARKNSKTTSLLFPFILYDALTTASAESYFVSASLEQAQKSFVELSNIIKETPELKDVFDCYSGAITSGSSRISFFSADTKALDSYKNSFSVVDEFHGYDNDKVITAFRYGSRARLNGTVCIITSAGNNTNSPCYNEVLKARAILDGKISDDSYFTVLYEYDEKDDWRDSSLLQKSNPAINTFLRPEILESDLQDALLTPSHQQDYKSKTCGIWNTQGLSNWLDPAEALQIAESEIDLTGRVCFAGLDLSQTQDLTVYTLCFEIEEDGEKKYIFKHRFYIPEAQVKAKTEKDSVNYTEWIEKGYVKTTAGATVDYDALIDDFCKDAEKYDIKECAFDRWNSRLVVNKMNDLLPHINFIDTDQSLRSFANPTKQFEKLALEKKLFDSNPVSRWCLSNAQIKPDANGNYKPLKVYKGASARIDSVITSIMSLDRAVIASSQKVKTIDFETLLHSF